jgi:hypothetical protein
MSSASAEAS